MVTDRLCSFAITYFTLASLTIILVPLACYALVKLRQGAMQQYEKCDKSLAKMVTPRSRSGMKDNNTGKERVTKQVSCFPLTSKPLKGTGMAGNPINFSVEKKSEPNVRLSEKKNLTMKIIATVQNQVFKNSNSDSPSLNQKSGNNLSKESDYSIHQNESHGPLELVRSNPHNESPNRLSEIHDECENVASTEQKAIIPLRTRPNSSETNGDTSFNSDKNVLKDIPRETDSSNDARNPACNKFRSIPSRASCNYSESKRKRIEAQRIIKQTIRNTYRRITAAIVVISIGGIISLYAGFADGIRFAQDCTSTISGDPYLGNDAAKDQRFPGRRNHGVVDFGFIIFFTFLVWYSGGAWSCKMFSICFLSNDSKPMSPCDQQI